MRRARIILVLSFALAVAALAGRRLATFSRVAIILQFFATPAEDDLKGGNQRPDLNKPR